MTPNVGTPDFDSSGERPIPDGHSFALLLTHDVDRPYKTYHSLYYALQSSDVGAFRHHIGSPFASVNPYWQFETIMDIEKEFGVRSAFYFLNEQRLRDRPKREWVTKRGWQLYAGRYDLTKPVFEDIITLLDEGGWEVGLHGSYESYDDRQRLTREKNVLEEILGEPVLGGRQHYLNLRIPETWRHHRAIGLRYDASLGSSTNYGFQHDYGIHRPFGDDFVVFPLTIMDQALPDPGDDYDEAVAVCKEVLDEAADSGAVMSILWHIRNFNPLDFPGFNGLYRHIIETALDMGAWVGSPGQFYDVAKLATPVETTDQQAGTGPI